VAVHPRLGVHGFLAYPTKSILKRMDLNGADFTSTVTTGRRRGGMIFLSHTRGAEEPPFDGLTGVEIDNRHYDANATRLDPRARADAHHPKQLAELEKSPRLYPDELFRFQCDSHGTCT